MPRSRDPPRGSTGSSFQRNDISNDQDEAAIPSNAVTSSNSRPQQSSWPEADKRRKSNVTFEPPAPSLAPSDSISKINTRTGTWPGRNNNSDKRGVKNSRTPWKSNRSQASRTSTAQGTAWSGSGAALTENNLERLNEANGKEESGSNNDPEPRSDEQEAPQSAYRSQRNGNAATNGAAQSNAVQQTSRQSSRRYSAMQNDYPRSRDTEGVADKGASRQSGANTEEGSSGSQSKQQTVAVSRNIVDANATRSQSKSQTVAASKNVIDANPVPSGTKQSSRGSQSKTANQSRSRNDSMLDEAEQTANGNPSGSQNIERSYASRTKAPSKPSSAGKPQSSGSPTSPTEPSAPRRWERKIRTITKRWPDGKEVREREVTVQPIGAA